MRDFHGTETEAALDSRNSRLSCFCVVALSRTTYESFESTVLSMLVVSDNESEASQKKPHYPAVEKMLPLTGVGGGSLEVHIPPPHTLSQSTFDCYIVFLK